jgi:uncharacterized phiE125 gp8 family phage protein
MALTKITDASVEPVTTADVETQLRLEPGTETAYLQALITAARTEAENRMQRTLLSTTWRLLLDQFPDAIRLQMPRIIGVQAVQYVDELGALQTLDPTLYSVDIGSEPGWIVPAWDQVWPSTREQINAVSVVYSAGYGNSAALVPAPIRQWILLAVGEMYNNRERGAVKPSVPHEFVDGLLDTYRVRGV